MIKMHLKSYLEYLRAIKSLIPKRRIMHLHIISISRVGSVIDVSLKRIILQSYIHTYGYCSDNDHTTVASHLLMYHLLTTNAQLLSVHAMYTSLYLLFFVNIHTTYAYIHICVCIYTYIHICIHFCQCSHGTHQSARKETVIRARAIL